MGKRQVIKEVASNASQMEAGVRCGAKGQGQAEDARVLIRVLDMPEQRALLRERPPVPWA
jgi:hypothetical protein